MDNTETHFDFLPEELLVLITQKLEPKDIYSTYKSNINTFDFLNNKRTWDLLFNYSNVPMLKEHETFYGYLEDYINIKKYKKAIDFYIKSKSFPHQSLSIKFESIKNIESIIKDIPELKDLYAIYFENIFIEYSRDIEVELIPQINSHSSKFKFLLTKNRLNIFTKLLDMKSSKLLLLILLYYNVDVKFYYGMSGKEELLVDIELIYEMFNR